MKTTDQDRAIKVFSDSSGKLLSVPGYTVRFIVESMQSGIGIQICQSVPRYGTIYDLLMAGF